MAATVKSAGMNQVSPELVAKLMARSYLAPVARSFLVSGGGGELSPNDHQGWVGHPEKVAAPNQCKGSRGSYLMSQGLLPFQRPDISPGYPGGRGRRDIPVLVSAGINLYPEQEIYPAQKDNTPSR